jgi:hypothetical protein
MNGCGAPAKVDGKDYAFPKDACKASSVTLLVVSRRSRIRIATPGNANRLSGRQMP